jgi:hypothetical protein
MTPVESPASVMLRISLPANVLDKYQIEAEDVGLQLEDLLANRLIECVGHTAAKPLYFDDAQRRRLEELIGKNVSKPLEALSILERLLTIRINSVPVTLKPEVITRLRTRHFGTEDFGFWLAKMVNKWAAEFTGLG